ncbi:MAG: hypothetical protein R6X32_13605, partial [Chloroflexota bacterium]
AMVRVYARDVQNSGAQVVVSLTGVRDGLPLGTLYADPRSLPQMPDRANLASTVNFTLPPDWLTGNVTLTAEISPLMQVANNQTISDYTLALSFNDVPALRVMIVPIDYTHQGPTHPGLYPAQPVDYISDWIERAFPIHDIDITIRTPHAFTGNLEEADSWETLLDHMYSLKIADGYSTNTPLFYYGFIPIDNGSSQWFSSGIAGIGWISPDDQAWRESLGLNLGQNDNTGILAGHEIGHNMGRRHAPCGNPAGVDPNYPYAGASIGEFAYDFGTASLLTPDTYRDVMSYCSPEWTSDYTYTALYDDQVTKGNWPDQAGTAANRLLVRAQLDQSDQLSLQPVYHMSLWDDDMYLAADSGYGVQLLDGTGNVLAEYPISLRYAEEPGIVARSLVGSVPLPESDTAVASLRIIGQTNGQTVVLAEQWLNRRALTQTMLGQLTETADFITLSWSYGNRPAIVRYTGDDGATWTTLAIDHLGGELTVAKEWLEGLSLHNHEQANDRFEIILANGTNANVLTLER